jgi:hypothetical protein
MESRFGYDFSGVRIHNDGKSSESADKINANAYTKGNNIVFGRGQYSPSTQEGKKLIAHELVHVIQQGKETDNKYANARNIMTNTELIQRECANGVWQYEYDACSVPSLVVFLIGASDKDNPAGGEDSHFSNNSRTGPCDKHDECYQTCGSSRERCDNQMYYDMMNICSKSVDAVRCIHFGELYYDGLRKYGGSAFRERQHESCLCHATSGFA